MNVPLNELTTLGLDWQEVLSAIERKVPQSTFNRWFRPLNAGKAGNGEVVVLTEDEFDAIFIEKNFSDLIRMHLEQIIGDTVKMRIAHSPVPLDLEDGSAQVKPNLLQPDNCRSSRVCLDDPVTRDPSHASLKTKPILSSAPDEILLEPSLTVTERIIDSGIKLQYSFDQFVVGSCNEFAYAASVAVAQNPGQSYNPLFLYGSVGLGKTHLLNAIGIELLRRKPQKRVLYQTSESFMNELIEHLQNKDMASFRSRYRDSLDLLLIDDIQFIAGKEATQKEFFHTFNALHQIGAQIVITSDRYPHEIPDLEERLRSRFQWGLVADIQAPAIETRLAILKSKAENLELELSDDVAMYIAQNVRSNVRELEGALLRLHAFVGFNHSPLNLTLARSLLKQFLQENTKRTTVESIQKAICAYYNIKLSDLKGKSRHRAVCQPRQIAMYLAKKFTGLSYPQLGEKFGGRDHTTILAGVRKIEQLLESDRTIKSAVDHFEKQLSIQ